MARYTEKPESDLAWNAIRRRVMYVANLRAAEAKERALNRILPDLQKQFEDALNAGSLLELGPAYLEDIEDVLSEELSVLGT